MYTARQLLAAGLVAVLGFLLVVRPATVLHLQSFTRGPTTGRRGPYADDPEYSRRTLVLLRAVGVAAVALGAVILVRPHL